jgi:hypothetical protein
MPVQRASSLAAWLIDAAREPLPPAALLRTANLAAHAYAALPPEHPARPALRGDYLASLTRHQQIKRELIPLIQRWNAVGIEPLLFKGFHLAEFVYPAPGMRHHGDVDLLVRPEHAALASTLARDEGWAEEHNSARSGRPYMHAVCSLYSPAGMACADLHRWMLHCQLPWNGVQRRVTEAVWARAEPREWEGVRIHLPAPVDALLVGLVLQRCWGDRWQLKPHDLLDFRFLTERLGVTREEVLERARELHVERTLSIFLAHCDPAAALLELRPPTLAERRRWDLAALGERGLPGTCELPLRRVRNLPHAVAGFARALPSLFAARHALGKHRDIEALLEALTPRTTRAHRSSPAWRDRVVCEVLRGARLFPRNPDGDCLLRSLALYHAIRRQGWPARFVSGLRREGDVVQGHAWVELDGRVLTELYESGNRQRYSVLVEYPRLESYREPAAGHAA